MSRTRTHGWGLVEMLIRIVIDGACCIARSGSGAVVVSSNLLQRLAAR